MAFRSPVKLPDDQRTKIVDGLNAILADGMDFYNIAKTAHWNVMGPLFREVHLLLDDLASKLAEVNDETGERVRTLGGITTATTRNIAKTSRLAEYPTTVYQDLDHVREVASRLDVFLANMTVLQKMVEPLDRQTFDMLTKQLGELEHLAWFFVATIEPRQQPQGTPGPGVVAGKPTR